MHYLKLKVCFSIFFLNLIIYFNMHTFFFSVFILVVGIHAM